MSGGRLPRLARRLHYLAPVCLSLLVAFPLGAAENRHLANPALVLTQEPVDPKGEREPLDSREAVRGECRPGSRIVVVEPGSAPRVLTSGFRGACDPDVSFDGQRILFSGLRDGWDIYEMELDGSAVRRITTTGAAFSPVYQGSLYTIEHDAPWHQITFVGIAAGEVNEYGRRAAMHLYTSRLDGSAGRRITFNPSSDLDPAVMPDGRLLFSSWQRGTLERGSFGRIALFAAHTDGLDYATVSGDQGHRIQRMPCVTDDRRVVFVESDTISRDGGGTLASIDLRRNLHSYRALTKERDGRFHSPSPLPGGDVLVSRRPPDGSGSYGVYRMDPRTARLEPVFDDPGYHDIQARLAASRPEPDGRSSVVSESPKNGVLYGLNVYESDRVARGWPAPGTPLRLRVLEGVPRRLADGLDAPGPLRTRILGEIDVEPDGSFNVEVPPEIPIRVQITDAEGLALASCDWIWVRYRETRGCIGCHEDGERAPENRFVDALAKRPVPLTLPVERRRTVDFRRDVLPIVRSSCSASTCHASGAHAPALGAAEDAEQVYRRLMTGVRPEGGEGWTSGVYVHPGRARTSPLIRAIRGRDTARPWDEDAPRRSVPACGASLDDPDWRILAEWIDLGARWSGTEPAPASVRGGGR
jgi:hypothetical protein